MGLVDMGRHSVALVCCWCADTAATVFRSYEQLPDLASALLLAGFSPEDVGAVRGGNYRRVFQASVG